MRFKNSFVALLALTLLGFLINPAVAVANEETNFSYGLLGNNKIFTNPTEALAGDQFQLAIKGGVAATILVDLVDIYADESGTKQPLPLDSSPFTAKDLVSFANVAGEYRPNGQIQNFNIPFSFKNIQNVARPILGGLRISIATQDAQTSSIKVAAAIVATFAYYPLGSAGELGSSLLPRLELTKPALTQLIADFIPFNLLPNLPVLFNRSPLTAKFELRNQGNIFLNTKTKLVVVDPRFFGSGSDTELFGIDASDVMLVPNQISQQQVNLTKPSTVKDEILDVFTGIGIYQVITTTTGSLGNKELVRTTQTNWVVIFPWKYALAFLMSLIIIFSYLRKKLNLLRSTAGMNLLSSLEASSSIDNFNKEFERIMAANQTDDDAKRT